MASHEAARRAVGAGYKDVNVMSDGILGWKKGWPADCRRERTESRKFLIPEVLAMTWAA